MESRYHGRYPLTPGLAMPYLAWMNFSHQEGKQGPSCVAPGDSGQVLLQELLWQFKQRECLALEEELQHRSRGTLGYRRPLTRPSLAALMPASESKQLERLCARIPPSHTTTVLFRFREILAQNDVLPWELVCVFKQVVRDFLRRQEEVGYRQPFPPPPPPMLLPVSPPPADGNTCDQETKKPSSPEGQEKHREEIPTISSYVDRHLRSSCPYTVQRDCLPYCHSFSYDESEAYSTTL